MQPARLKRAAIAISSQQPIRLPWRYRQTDISALLSADTLALLLHTNFADLRLGNVTTSATPRKADRELT
jgi:hypothetical protein